MLQVGLRCVRVIDKNKKNHRSGAVRVHVYLQKLCVNK